MEGVSLFKIHSLIFEVKQESGNICVLQILYILYYLCKIAKII